MASNQKARDASRRWREKNRDKYLAKQKEYRDSGRYQESAQQKARLRRDMISAIKTASGCVDCGYNQHPAALDFDHLPGSEKVASIGNMYNGRWDKVLAEIAKCEVVCSNCHRIRTHMRRDPNGNI